MSKVLLKIYLIFFFVGMAHSIRSQSPYYYYKQLGIKEGLSQSRVQCILNDHRGYLWIGTESGLNCYDRDHLKHYLHRPEDESTLPSDNIIFIAEDSLHNLWVATTVGICLYNRGHDNFKTLSSNGKPIYVASSLLVEGEFCWVGQVIFINILMPLINLNLYIMQRILLIMFLLGDGALR